MDDEVTIYEGISDEELGAAVLSALEAGLPDASDDELVTKYHKAWEWIRAVQVERTFIEMIMDGQVTIDILDVKTGPLVAARANRPPLRSVEE